MVLKIYAKKKGVVPVSTPRLPFPLAYAKSELQGKDKGKTPNIFVFAA